MTRDTVWCDTPASRATSYMTARRPPFREGCALTGPPYWSRPPPEAGRGREVALRSRRRRRERERQRLRVAAGAQCVGAPDRLREVDRDLVVADGRGVRLDGRGEGRPVHAQRLRHHERTVVQVTRGLG